MTPYLVVTTGFPCAGKTQASLYLQQELGFTRFSTDDLRENLYGITDYHSFQKDSKFREKEDMVFRLMMEGKMLSVLYGIDVVLDSSASSELMRTYLLDTRVKEGIVPAEKSLLYINAKDEILIKRNKDKGRRNDPVSEWKKFWEEPKENQHYNLISYENNTESDLEHMILDLDKRFRRDKNKMFGVIKPGE